MKGLPWRAWTGGLVFGLLVYVSITSFSHARDDNVQRVVARMFAAAALLLLLRLFVSGSRWQFSRPLTALQLALAASALISTFCAPRWPIAWDRLVMYCALAVWAVSVHALHGDEEREVAPPYLLAVAIAHAAILFDIVLWLVHSQQGDSGSRLPYYGNVRHFGYLGYLAAASALALGAMSRRMKFTSLLLCAAALFGILQLGSRGALLGWMVFLLVGCYVSRERMRWALSGLAATVLAILASWAMADRLLHGSDSIISRAQHGDLAGASGRLSLWADVWRAIMVRPLWGYGPDGHRFLDCCGSYGPYIAKTVQPHNVVLQLLEEFGLIGFMLMAALLLHVARRHAPKPGWWAAARQHTELGSLLALLGGLLAFGMVDGPFYYPVPLVIASTIAALLMLAARRASSEQRS